MPMLKTALALTLVGFAAAECPNACSGHGVCGVFDMCTCYRNWQAADCSQRTCPFDLAHVDTPKGDLNHDNAISGSAAADVKLVGSTVYPKGTTEMFPSMLDTAGNAAYTSAHYYMECSNKGICDRTTGECDCYDGYDGTACQRASCPNDCSGHGTCETIADIAFKNFENAYQLWDKDATMGCSCDAGYGAADCSQRHCKVGVDPLYSDDNTIRHSIFDVRIFTAAASKLGGTFQLKVYDAWGEDFVTVPILASTVAAPGDGTSTCTPLIAALVGLPNNVINSAVPPTCAMTQDPTTALKGYSLRIAFPGNAGYLRSVEVLTAGLTDLDSAAATASTAGATVSTIVTGENTDYFANKCTGVTAKFAASSDEAAAPLIRAGEFQYLNIATDAEKKLLKACLGDSDGDATNNVEVYNWDYGNMREPIDKSATVAANWQETAFTASASLEAIGAFPHAIKSFDPLTGISEYHLLWYRSVTNVAGENFRIVGNKASASIDYDIYTTNGVVQQLGYDRVLNEVMTDNTANLNDNQLTANRTEIRIVGYFNQYSNKIYTNIDASCESTNPRKNGLHNCIQKGDRLFVVDGCWGTGSVATEYFGGFTPSCTYANANKDTGNMYTVNKIYTKPWTINTDEIFPSWANAERATGGTYDPSGGVVAYDGSTDADNTATGTGGTPAEDRFVIEVDHNISWDGSTLANTGNQGAVSNSGYIVLFKFTPASDGAGSYTYVSECSNRGACDRESGLCQCFKGYTSDNCSVQSSLAV